MCSTCLSVGVIVRILFIFEMAEMIKDPRMLCKTKKKKKHEFNMTAMEGRNTWEERSSRCFIARESSFDPGRTQPAIPGAKTKCVGKSQLD